MRIQVHLRVFLLSMLLSACNTRQCPKGFDFTSDEYALIPYKTDSLLLFRNERGAIDTFYITGRDKRIVDKGYEIETSSNDWLELEISYTNKNFYGYPEDDRQLAWITKGCKDQNFSVSASWMDFWDGLNFGDGTHLSNYSYPDTIKEFSFNKEILMNVLKFQTDTTKWPDAVQRNVKSVYWLPGEGVIMYETRQDGIWKKIK